MTPTEALEWAADYADRNNIFTAPRNDRGYIKDGWKEPTPAEKISVIKELAASVIDYPVVTLPGQDQISLLKEIDHILHDALGGLYNEEVKDKIRTVRSMILRHTGE